MNIEETIKNCEMCLKQLKRYDPDPYYVNYFFNEYVNSVNDIINGIFEEGNIDFGLFISGKISQEKFEQNAKEKNDQNAIKFSKWYSMQYNQEHQNPYPSFIKKVCQYKDESKKLPEIKIMIRASERYKNDIYQQIKINSSHEKLHSKEELEIEIKRQLPIFLEIINDKRNKNNESKVGETQVVASAFLDIEGCKDVEIAFAAEIYIQVMKRLVEESREKIKELTTWK